MLEGLAAMKVYVDDIIIWGSTAIERSGMIARANNVNLNKAKRQFQTAEIKYLGERLTSKGILPDESTIQAVVRMTKSKRYKRNSKDVRHVAT